MKIDMTTKQIMSLLECAHYLLDNHERKDYVTWCEEEGVSPADINNNEHIYATALVAVGLEYE